MRRIVIALLALVAFSGFAEAHSRHHYHHHHRGYGYNHHHHHLHFRGRHHHHHRYAYRAERQALAAEAPAEQSWFGGPAPAGQSWFGAPAQQEYPQVRGRAARSRTPGGATLSYGASSAAGRLVSASWYGGGERLSSRTASGEHFNRGGLTAAHRSLPFGTRVSVTNPKTGASVVVRINDRGPFVRGRSLDLARGAAQAIGLRSTGPVRMVVLN